VIVRNEDAMQIALPVTRELNCQLGLLTGVRPQMASHAYDCATAEKVVTEPDTFHDGLGTDNKLPEAGT
jgi:hypothetical protein